MKKSFTIIVLALIASAAIAQTFSMEDLEGLRINPVDEGLQGPLTGLDIVSVSFDVDKNLPAPKEALPKYDDKEIARRLVNISAVPENLHRVVKTSFEGQRLSYIGDDNFYKCLVQAYADHHPLVLSPDMVWLIISQGFSRYVNAHAEEMRDLLVFHEGKMDLVVNSNNDVLSLSGDWKRLLNDFSACIANNTKGELADLMTADFTTTGITERVASQISLMDAVKKYFNYANIAAGCGIPSITLKGSPDDWQKVLDKTLSLKKYHLEKWVSDLEPILKEFVKASKGRANKKFWRDIVKKVRVDQLKKDGGVCAPPKHTTYLDGWFLKFFPNALGETSDSVMWTTNMPQEMVRVSFLHIYVDPATRVPIDTIPMQLWAGFVGVEEDASTRALTPKIGWLARIADEESDELARLKEKNEFMTLYFYMHKDQKVPHVLSKMDHIRSLILDFGGNPVVIPEWMDNILIDKLQITGQFTDDEEARLRQRFPKAELKQYVDYTKGLKRLPIKESEDDSNNIDSVLIVVDSEHEAVRVSKSGYKDAIWIQPADTALTVRLIPASSPKQQPIPLKTVTTTGNGVKAGDKISGTLSDEAGPLFGGTVCEIDANGRIVESAITDMNGAFRIEVRNPEDHIRFSYVGMKTTTVPIDRKEYNIKMKPVESQYDYKMLRRQSGRSTLPIPQREMKNVTILNEDLKGFTVTTDKGVSNENNPRITIPVSDKEQALVMSVNDLGFNMFRKLGAKNNILLSPMGELYLKVPNFSKEIFYFHFYSPLYS